MSGDVTSFLLSRAGTRTCSLVLLQALLNYVRFLATDKHTSTECVVKTFGIAPFIIFGIQYSLERVLWEVRCEHSLSTARSVVLTSGLFKSVVFTWSNLSVFEYLQGPLLPKTLSVVITLLVMFGIFCLTGYVETMYLRDLDMSCQSTYLAKSKKPTVYPNKASLKV